MFDPIIVNNIFGDNSWDVFRVWKEITLNASSDQSQYRVWDYPIKEQYGHILQAIEKTGPVPDAATGFAKVTHCGILCNPALIN